MQKIEAKKEIEMGPTIAVALPRKYHDMLSALVAFSGLARGSIISDAVIEMLDFQATKNTEFATKLQTHTPIPARAKGAK